MDSSQKSASHQSHFLNGPRTSPGELGPQPGEAQWRKSSHVGLAIFGEWRVFYFPLRWNCADGSPSTFSPVEPAWFWGAGQLGVAETRRQAPQASEALAAARGGAQEAGAPDPKVPLLSPSRKRIEGRNTRLLGSLWSGCCWETCVLHFFLLWFSGKSPLSYKLNVCSPSNVNQAEDLLVKRVSLKRATRKSPESHQRTTQDIRISWEDPWITRGSPLIWSQKATFGAWGGHGTTSFGFQLWLV